jgi:hypothetical protein
LLFDGRYTQSLRGTALGRMVGRDDAQQVVGVAEQPLRVPDPRDGSDSGFDQHQPGCARQCDCEG